MSELALRLIEKNKRTKSTFLDLGNCGLTELPDELSVCVWLEELNLGDWYWDFKQKKWVQPQSNGSKNNLKNNSLRGLYYLSELRGLYLGNNQINNLHFLEKLTKLQTLYLSRNQISDLSFLKMLTKLQALYLSNNRISDLRFLQKLTGLQILHLSNNQISDLLFLQKLTKLQTLNLSNNQICDLHFLQKLTGLQALYLSNNPISDLAFLEKLPGLQNLHLSNNQIHDLRFLEILPDLQILHLSNNQISDLQFLERLTRLEVLHLSNNPIRDYSFLGRLTMLQTLHLSNNQISDLRFLERLTRLQTLHLSNNQISDLRVLERMTDLQTLQLSNNQISDLRFLEKLTGLQSLDLSTNQISDLSGGLIKKLVTIKKLKLYGNPILNIPSEIYDKQFENVLDAVRDYFQSIAKPKEVFPLYEAKLLLVGRGSVGKSELAEALSEPDYQFDENRVSTEGIRIKEWHPAGCVTKEAKTIDFKVNLWDFGGQEVYYGTHQFFLTKNSLYILVWDARQDEDTQTFGYWLRAIGLLSEQSPVLVVQNKADERTKPLNQETLKKAFPFIVGFYQTSCKLGDGLPELRREIQQQLMQLPHIGEKWNVHRVNVRWRLEQDERDFITETEYLQICAEEGLKGDEPVFLSNQLHALGVILHFQDDELLQNTVILKPEWATAAVYKIIDSKLIKDQQFGRFSLKNVRTVWHEARYAQKRPELLQLMKRFELCFQFQDQDRYIVPEICPPEPSFPLPDFKDDPQVIRLEYRYEFMPKSIMTRFICRNHNAIRGEEFWPSGVVLAYDGALALLQADEIKKKIQVTVSGKAAKEVLFLIRREIEHIHDTIKKPPVSEMIPCICSECVADEQPFLFKYATLRKFQDKGIAVIRCERSADEVSIKTLTEGIIDLKQYAESPLNDHLRVVPVYGHPQKTGGLAVIPPKTVRIFLASSSELKEDREQFEIFINRENKRLNNQSIFLELNIWEDFIDAMSKTRLQDEYNKVIRECDFFVSLFFTKAGKYTAEEFEVAFQQFTETQKPKVYTYFKDAPFPNAISREEINSLFDFKEKISALGHFRTSYTNIDNLTNQFKSQLEKVLPSLK